MRTLDARPFNLIAEHPEVRPWLGAADPTAPLDLAPLVGDVGNFAFLTEHEDGGYIYCKLQPGLYFLHTLAMPAARGRPMLKLLRSGLAAMFCATDAVEIVTMIPDGNEKARKWSDVAGFRDTFRREKCFSLMGDVVGCQHRSLSYGDWVTSDPHNVDWGQQVQSMVAMAQGSDGPLPVNRVREAWMGATTRGCIEHNVTKAVGMFNRWASQAAADPITLIGLNPPVLDTGEAVLELLSGTFEVLSARSVLHPKRNPSCQ